MNDFWALSSLPAYGALGEVPTGVNEAVSKLVNKKISKKEAKRAQPAQITDTATAL